MTTSPHDLSHLSGLIEAARGEAERMGVGFAATAALLAQALDQVRTFAERGGHPDEGTPLDQLTTENDR